MQKGVAFLGYKIFYKNKILRKRNRKYFLKKLDRYLDFYNAGLMTDEQILSRLQGWFGYAQWANTYLLRKRIVNKTAEAFSNKGSKKIEELHKTAKLSVLQI